MLLLLWLQAALAAPWSPGDPWVDGWTVRDVVEHPEFVRLAVEAEDGRRTTLEIVRATPDDVYGTRRYRLQPAPGEEAIPDLYERSVPRLDELEGFPARKTAPKPPPAEPSAWTRLAPVRLEEDTPWRAAWVAFAVALAALGAARARGSRADAWAIAPAVLGLALGAGALSAPVEPIFALQEGGGFEAVGKLVGRGGHGGAANRALVRWFGGAAPDLDAVVRAHTAAGLAAVGLLGAVVARRAGPLVALLAALAALRLSPAVAMGSEVPATPLWLAQVGAVAAVAGLWTARGRLEQALGWVALALGTGLAAGIRPETAVLGVFGGAAVLARPWADRIGAAARRATDALWSGSPWAWAAVAALALVPLPDTAARVHWALAAAHPLHPSTLTLPFGLAGLVPLGFVALVVLGVVAALRRNLAEAALALAVLALYRAYYAASHLWLFELLRYASLLWPLLVLLAVAGWEALRAWVEPRAGRGGVVAAAAALAIGSLAPPPTGQFGVRGVRGAPDLLHQQELRILQGIVRDHPGCAVLSRVSSEDVGRDRGPPWRWALVRPAEGVVSAAPAEGTPEEALRTVPDACVILWRGQDSNLVAHDDCSALVDGLEPLVEVEVAGRPYNDPQERGLVRDPARLGAYWLRRAE